MGFCFGVKRAVSTAKQAADQRGKVTSLGHLVHNDQVVRWLEGSGVSVAEALEDVGTGPVVISAHGVGRVTYDEAKRAGLEVIDATCPIVRQIQRKARQLAEAGYTVVVFGDQKHSEVRGVVGWTGDKAFVVENVADLDLVPPARKVAVVSQSTMTQSSFNVLLAALIHARMHEIQELVVHNTLCSATTSAQAAARELAREVGVIVVVGGRNSANTKHLADVCAAMGVPTHHIEDESELRRDWFERDTAVGVTAGASTPEWVVSAVVGRIRGIGAQLEAEQQED
jgi:4-hydroxy-3-methylbut-2-enyl diphosphate reductase